MNKKEQLSILTDLIQLKSQVNKENEDSVAAYIIKFLRGFGIEPRIIKSNDKRINIIANVRFGDGIPKIILNGHMDTKPALQSEEERREWIADPFSAEVIDGKVYGRGACDMKAGLAAFLITVKEIMSYNGLKNGELELQFVADEEMGSYHGMKYLTDVYNYDFYADLAIVAEPTNNEICKSELGNLWLKWKVNTDGGHAGLAFKYKNAIDVMNEVIGNVRKAVRSYREFRVTTGQDFPYNELHDMNIGFINGGVHPGTVPNYCEALIDIRIKPDEDRNTMYEIVTGCLRDIEDKYKGVVTVGIETFSTGGYPPCKSDGNELTNTLFQLNQSRLKKETYGGFYGASDAFYLMESGVNTVIFGPGSLEQAHAINEYVSEEQFYDYTSLLTEFLLDVFTDKTADRNHKNRSLQC
ncbi:acetylornithine deacetylase/succinyl-diaminopimelate desuccinylase family protein [Bacillus mesophilus]|uniref:M20 family metallopeptidase n=1 Tax=Bacillus mesophilus TaxID=1808955 RepID=A0A6M0Q9M9_9BACI|nr:acetylornithine deacetylase/succinyl-diaminopimelate desuccinylase family protein [Bacillus mesophilus]NEY73086.1 M20 family metallopeptidase [Bacillus mesophilus]